MNQAAPSAENEAAHAAQSLLDAVRRIGRRPQGHDHGRLALVLHLSRLRPPAPRPHHRRIARAMLADTALRHDGQVFAMANGDLAMLCRMDGPAAPARNAACQDPVTLSRTLGRLLLADAADPDRLVSLWDLREEGAAALSDYATARLREAPCPPPEDEAAAPDRLDALAALIDSTAAIDLLQRQSAMLLPGRAAAGGRQAMRPLFRELTFSAAGLEARLAPRPGLAGDPYLLRHLAPRLDRRILALLAQPGGAGAGFAPPAGGRLHVNLSLPGILSADFAGLAGQNLGIEVAAMDACADPAGFAAARLRLSRAGMTLVLDGLSHVALLVARPWALLADLLKLDWSADIAGLPAHDAARLDAALLRIGPERLVLNQADSEAALQWGLARGIRRFQGRHADAMLAAARMVSCPLAGGCALRQCVERGLATGGAGRASCGNPALLDAAMPQADRAVA